VLFSMSILMMCDILNVCIILGGTFNMLKIIRCDILNNNKLACAI
jgi:hypothetical protein